jgi:hypothetical protein
MPLVRLNLRPGIDKQNTEYGAQGGWTDCDNVRFRYGLPEKIGGWVPFQQGDQALIGMISKIFNWNDLNGTPYSIVGTNRKLYVYAREGWQDITPIRATGTGATFTTVAGSDQVTVNLVAHGAQSGDFVRFFDVTGGPGGIPNATLANEFEIQAGVALNEFVIVSPTAAVSDATEAGDADAEFQINVGSNVSLFDFGWGTGTWGLSTWNTARDPSSVTGSILNSRVWQFDNYGQDVICQVCEAGIFRFIPPATAGDPIARATAIPNAPTKAQFALTSTPDRHLVSFGAEQVIGSPNTQDKMFVRFSSQEDPTVFEPTATNTAGGQRLTDGSRIVGAIRSRGQILIFTDTSLHAMQFVGPPFTFGFQQISSNCGLIAPQAAVDVDGMAFWMCTKGFFVFDGTAKKIPCSVQDFVYDDINLIQAQKINVGVNSQFSEVTWFYCSFTSDFIDRCVTYNYMENVWTVGSLARTAWEDTQVFKEPLAADFEPDATDDTSSVSLPVVYGLTPDRSYVYRHETGTDAENEPLPAFIESGYFDIQEGENMLLMRRFVPDFKSQVGDLTVRLLLRPFPQASASPSSLDPYIISPNTQKVDTRARGRQVALRIEGDGLGSNWRYGTLRVDVQPDGSR